ncbi:MAG: DUF2723 domain-containing protein [Acidimicrobiia bacterium]|nr:DUF2723 domain-containing protein [Acidimicrobiia bacterium]
MDDDPNTAGGRRRLATAGVVLVLGLVYGQTLLPGTGFSGDTAKFQFIGRVVGTPHNTGYPTYVLLNAAFVRLMPVGSLAWRANLLSAVFAVAACTLLCLLLQRVGTPPLVAGVSSIVLGLTYTFWSQAVVAEVYTLHLLLMAAVATLLVGWERERREGWLFAAAAMTALSLGNHVMTVLLLPGIVYFVVRVGGRAVFTRRTLAILALILVAGLGQYGFVVWRSHRLSPEVYVQSSARTAGELVDVLRGAEFRDAQAPFSLRELTLVRGPLLWGYARREWSWLLAVAALGVALRLRAPLTGMLVAWTVANVVFVLNFDVVDAAVFLLPSYFCMAVWTAQGLTALRDALPERARPAGLVLGVAPVVFAVWSFTVVDRSKNLDDVRSVEQALAAAPDGSLLVSNDYERSQFAWYHLLGEGEGERRDLLLADRVERRALLRYVDGRGPLELRFTARTVEPGRPVLALDGEVAESARRAGFRVRPAGPSLWRLE